jgi:hypothetical protein
VTRGLRTGARTARIALACVLACAGIACATVRIPEGRPVSFEAANEAWARVLECCVDERGRVDFARIAREPRDLELFVRHVAEVDPESDAGAFPTVQARLAHHMNAYNALSMYGVIDLGIPRTNAGLRKVRFFFLRRYRIAGRKETLYAYESRIRAIGDPRVHFALNCMSVSCPQLPRVPFRAQSFERDIDALSRSFVDDRRYVQVDAAARRVRVSAIFKFYTKDFLAEADSLIGYINRLRREPIPADYEVEFLPYDWTINRT